MSRKPKEPHDCQKYRILQTNRKNKDFWECERCGAFLGWV